MEEYFEYYLLNDRDEPITIKHYTKDGRIQVTMDFDRSMSTEDLKKFCEECNFTLIPQCNCCADAPEEKPKPRLRLV
jgi:hypothetical protein